MLAGSLYGAFDLDDCRNPATGEVAEWALAKVQDAASYAEVTTSGTGLRVLGLASGPKVHRNQVVPGTGGRLETYRGCERYIVVTGEHLPGSPEVLAEIDAEIDATVAWLDEAKQAAKTAKAAAGRGQDREQRRTDLPPDLDRLIRSGAPEGQRSEAFFHAVGWLKDLGWTVTAIVALLERHPGGIAEKYAGRLEPEVARAFDRAADRLQAPRSGGSQHSGVPSRKRTVPAGPVVTEDSAAVHFAALHAGRLRYCHDTGAWFEWDGAAWRQARVPIAFQWARELARDLAKPYLDEPKIMATLGRTTFAGGVERFARADPAFAVTHDTWDRDLFLLGTPGGTVDLRTGELREPDPADGITKLTAVAPAETPDCPLWLAFLDQATKSDHQLMRLIRQLAGYALTGDTREHVLPFAWGGGGNGKGVLINTLGGILGNYAVVASMETFVATTGERHPTDLAMLRGARLVTASETEEDRAWAEARIKQMTGGDPITARFMRRDFFTYQPQFKLLIMGNNRPNLRNVDDAMRRRFIMLPFEHKPARPDPLLPEKLKAEWPAILRWAVEGCLDWQQNGLIRSTRDRDATEEYFASQDAFGQWLAEACDVEPGNEYKTATSTELFTSWRAFAQRIGDDPGSQRAFAGRMEKRGIGKRKSHGQMVYEGIRLLVRRPFHEAAE
ncbi:hypothetical protein EU555_30500 [Methylobacterium nonmethylotrophicum]|uniref:SF3 helicase domain-containing protein n=2 Tax=Methylobacterium nonmethylotrophicum TaxID=1141884 RepID=A0A4Z0NGQ4_9HYPH|nr:hypothetical protein EU555_30500 [Methylobacterium nonmethylotrophicum]